MRPAHQFLGPSGDLFRCPVEGTQKKKRRGPKKSVTLGALKGRKPPSEKRKVRARKKKGPPIKCVEGKKTPVSQPWPRKSETYLLCRGDATGKKKGKREARKNGEGGDRACSEKRCSLEGEKEKKTPSKTKILSAIEKKGKRGGRITRGKRPPVGCPSVGKETFAGRGRGTIAGGGDGWTPWMREKRFPPPWWGKTQGPFKKTNEGGGFVD